MKSENSFEKVCEEYGITHTPLRSLNCSDAKNKKRLKAIRQQIARKRARTLCKARIIQKLSQSYLGRQLLLGRYLFKTGNRSVSNVSVNLYLQNRAARHARRKTCASDTNSQLSSCRPMKVFSDNILPMRTISTSMHDVPEIQAETSHTTLSKEVLVSRFPLNSYKKTLLQHNLLSCQLKNRTINRRNHETMKLEKNLSSFPEKIESSFKVEDY